MALTDKLTDVVAPLVSDFFFSWPVKYESVWNYDHTEIVGVTEEISIGGTIVLYVFSLLGAIWPACLLTCVTPSFVSDEAQTVKGLVCFAVAWKILLILMCGEQYDC